MKTKIFIIVAICLPFFTWGQFEKVKQVELPNVNVTPPEFTGITNVNHLLTYQTESIGDYLNKNIEYPVSAASYYKQGTAVVQFVVTADGELTDFRIINSVCPIID